MKITTLAGGIGAAKFLLGLIGVAPPEQVTVIANTGDDIELFGLRISPDVDTLIYTLARVVDEAKGWGIAGDSFHCLSWLARYGEATWFNLGDRDLATHIYRTQWLRRGRSLSEITDHIRRSLGVRSRILPMTDSYIPTRIVTDEGEMHFQEYFVRRRCQPRVKAIEFKGIETSQPAPGVISAILQADLVIICPSNPLISIGPILAVPGLRDALKQTQAKIAAITPIIGGRALKGPAADMLRDLGYEASARAVALLYSDFLDLFVLDETDRALRPAIEELGMRAVVCNTIMDTIEDKRRLARQVLEAVYEECAIDTGQGPN
jgi:LPPG:FO 2-phospho-L-lactate transferase